MKKNVLLSLVVLFALALTACAPAAAEEGGTIKIANLSPLTGQTATFGQSTKNGFEMAVEEWNAKGGVIGKTIETVVEDSQCTPDPAVNAANKVIDQDGAHYIVGEVCSSASIPVSVVAEEKGVLQISPTSTSDLLTVNADGSTKKFVFRACYNDSFQGYVMGKFAIEKGYKKAFVTFDQGNDYTIGLAESFEKTFTDLGGEIVGKETYTSTDTDFSTILTKVKDSGAEVLWVGDYYPVVNLIGAQAKQLAVTAVMMGGDGWDSSDLDLAASDGGFYSNHYSVEDQREIVQDWVAKYTEKFGSAPDALATLAYDATNILLKSIEAAGVDDPAKVAEAMAAINVEGVSGSISYNELHNPVKAAVVLQVKDGAVNYVTTVNP